MTLEDACSSSCLGPMETRKVPVLLTKETGTTEESSVEAEEEPQVNPEPSNHRNYSRQWSRVVLSLRVLVCRSIKMGSHFSATHPWTTVLVTIALAVIVSGAGLATNFHIETDTEHLLRPDGCLSLQHKTWVDQESGFPKDPTYFFMIVHADGDNLLNHAQQGVEKTFQAVDTIRAMPGYSEVCQDYFLGPNYGLKQERRTCPIRGIVDFWNDSTESFQEQVLSDHDAIVAMSAIEFPNTRVPVDANQVFGNLERDTNGTLTKAQAYIIQIDFPSTSEADALELEILEQLSDLQREWDSDSANSFRLEFFGSQSMDVEGARAVTNDIPLMPIAFLVMTLFNIVVYARWNDKVKSQSLLGIGAVVAVVLAIMVGYGLNFLLGIPLTSGSQVLIFVMFGIGVDDALIISGSFHRTDPTKDPVQRIDDTIEDVGLSITLTTLTSAVAFSLGCTSKIPYIYLLCYYAVPTVLAIFFYQTTFFVALTVIDQQRMADGRMDCLVCYRAQDNSTTRSCSGKPSLSLDGTEEMNSIDSSRSEVLTAGSTTRKLTSEQFMEWYSQYLLRPWAKAIVIVFFVLVFAGCTYLTTNLRQEFQWRDVVPQDSHAIGYLDARENYCTNSMTRGGFVYFRNVDQSDVNIQQQMDDYMNDLVSSKAITDQPKYFWLRHFQLYMEQLDANDYTRAWLANATFTEQLDAFLAVPAFGSLYRDHIVRDEDTGEIITSRCFVYITVDVGDTRAGMDHLSLFQEVTGAQPVNQDEPNEELAFFSFSRVFYTWENNASLVIELTYMAACGVAAVSGIALLFIPHYTAILFVFPCISTLYIDLLGFLQFAGVSLNAITYIELVMSIGLMVDFIMHTLIRYYEVGGTRSEKVSKTLTSIGSSILLGGLSTFLGVMALAFSASVAFQTIFRAFIGLVALGCSYGLVLLPVILSLVGPEETL